MPYIDKCFPPSAQVSLPVQVEKFCFPDAEQMTMRSERGAAEEFTFVLTRDDGSRLYGFCRRSLQLGRMQLWRHDYGNRMPQCLCILSDSPYFQIFSMLLKVVQSKRWLAPKTSDRCLGHCKDVELPSRAHPSPCTPFDLCAPQMTVSG